LAEGRVQGLDLNYARGFREPNLGFLRDWPIRHLDVLDRSLTDLTPIARMAGTLRSLSFQIAPRATLDVRLVPQIVSLAAQWECVRDTLDAAPHLTRLVAMDYDERDLVPLATHESLAMVVLKYAPRLRSTTGVADLRGLLGLTIQGAAFLDDLDGLDTTGGTLSSLKLEGSRGIESLDEIGELVRLEFLGVSDGGTLESLRPLRSLRRLQTLYAWGTTRIADGDLSPLLELPELREIRMRNRPQYRPSVAEVQSALAPQD
jgi:hypothetical protein